MNKKLNQEKSSVFNLDANIVVIVMWIISVAVYWWLPLLSWVLPLVILIVEVRSRLVRVHAGQAMAILLILAIIKEVINILIVILHFIVAPISSLLVPFLILIKFFGLISRLTIILAIISTIVACIEGLQWKEWKIPIIGDFGDVFTQKIKRK